MSAQPVTFATMRSRAIGRVLALSFALLVLVAPPSQAQGLLPDDDPRRAEILAVVTALFDGMRAADSASIRALFHPEAQLMTTGVRDGQPVASRDALDGFLRSVGTVRPEKLDERTKNERVLLDGTLAVVWTDYDLFLGSRFIHCGVDAFQMAKVGTRWLILALADTRRQQGCTPAGNDVAYRVEAAAATARAEPLGR